MTDVIPPPEDRLQRLVWASQLLRDWSRPEYANLLGAAEIRQLAAEVLAQNRVAPSPLVLPPEASQVNPQPEQQPQQKRVPRPKRRPRRVPGKGQQPPP